ncbi:MAG: HEAT repeat domain-containing protein [Leptolyngbya sp. SIO1D8]|nr:HEAT repeat domain-containing protein [Leptolyngbya sp. SIO1D8]
MSPTPASVKQLLASSDVGDRLRAVNQMRELDPAIAFELVQPACTDSSSRVRYAAISQMDTLGQQDLQKALDILRQALKTDPEPDVQSAAADALGGLKILEAFDDLRSVYEDTGEWLVKFSIVAALGEFGDPRAFELLVSALDSDIQLVSTAAIGALGELGDERAIPLLLPYVNADDWQVRHRVAQALSQFNSTETRAALEQLSQDSSAAVADTARYYIDN